MQPLRNTGCAVFFLQEQQLLACFHAEQCGSVGCVRYTNERVRSGAVNRHLAFTLKDQQI